MRAMTSGISIPRLIATSCAVVLDLPVHVGLEKVFEGVVGLGEVVEGVDRLGIDVEEEIRGDVVIVVKVE